MNRQPNIVGLITVENDVWIGTGSVILKDSHITEGCVIAANSVVKGTLEPFSIYGGAPAKKIGIRK
jgi:acetyltransferase-like isoleucine patch superfamily enzyme